MYSIINSSRDHYGFLIFIGRFSLKSTKGNEYILVTYDYDTNAITATPKKKDKPER